MDSITVNSFGLGILVNGMSADKENIDGGHYFLLSHNDQYKLKLHNGKSSRCDAEVWVDGELIGVWRINPYSTIIIERPTAIDRKFVFLEENSTNAQSAGIVSGRRNNGLVKVIFRPERQALCSLEGCIGRSGYSPWMRGVMYNQSPAMSNKSFDSRNLQGMCNFSSLNENACYDSSPSYSHGATALGGYSNQKFSSTNAITDIDDNNVTTIMARLMIKRSHWDRPLVSLSRALNQNNYPARLEPTRFW